ncbi:MAG: 3-deoxy-7-phosphoheptulonate synthase [Christensenellales bacterium]|jgi:3-deoxy-7-phosphoheptulonate synthase
MIVVMKGGSPKGETENVVKELEGLGMQVQMNDGIGCMVLGVIGDTISIDKDKISMMPGVDRIMPVSEPFKKANRKVHPGDTIIRVGNVTVGGKKLTVMAGPCSVESKDQIGAVAMAVKDAGAKMLRGGAYKPRTSPYAFQGLEKQGLDMLLMARELTGLPIVTEIMSPRHVEMFEMVVDVIQIGARNMQNFDLLKEVGRTKKPVLLKRGLSSTIEEWLMSAEYILNMGNPNVILCERGIRTFETYTRNTLDLSSIPAVKRMSHLPIIVDPSHACGMSWMVESMAMAAVAAGADGLLIEVHNDPKGALCDGPQSLTPEQFDSLMQKLRQLAPLVGRELD